MASDHDHHHHHHPDDAQHGGPHDSDEFTERNRAHWDKTAASYAAEAWQIDMLNKVHQFVASNISWIGVDFIEPSSSSHEANTPHGRAAGPSSVRVLDYACGPGTITNVLQGHATEFVGIDLSTNMAKAYNERFAAKDGDDGKGTINAHAVVGNLLGRTESAGFSGPEYSNFDLVVVGLGFHHFENTAEATRRLSARLRPGGVFLIVDLESHSGEMPDDEPAKHTVAHNGFSESQVRDIFSSAGLVDVAFLPMDGEVMMRGQHRRTIFMARGRRAAL